MVPGRLGYRPAPAERAAPSLPPWLYDRSTACSWRPPVNRELELFQEHRVAAYRQAKRVSRCDADADDLVSEAFCRTFERNRQTGQLPTRFRSYLLTCVRHLAYDRSNAERRLDWSADHESISSDCGPAEWLLDAEELTLTGKALAQLPASWRQVLWQTAVLDQSASILAEAAGCSGNTVSAQAYRAREGLRAAYLQVQAPEPVLPGCGQFLRRAGDWLRGRLALGQTTAVDGHLASCQNCWDAFCDVAATNPQLVRVHPRSVDRRQLTADTTSSPRKWSP
ncbi:sigma-70 family RNA polymerase sigma factor [Pseudonocardiaceae bacterium YIM PH 21723]|nr:sigma-70 family RNA polymerase sigma factor [Pseudonocardiaceae bacterium YIM PH 21723]